MKIKPLHNLLQQVCEIPNTRTVKKKNRKLLQIQPINLVWAWRTHTKNMTLIYLCWLFQCSANLCLANSPLPVLISATHCIYTDAYPHLMYIHLVGSGHDIFLRHLKLAQQAAEHRFSSLTSEFCLFLMHCAHSHFKQRSVLVIQSFSSGCHRIFFFNLSWCSSSGASTQRLLASSQTLSLPGSRMSPVFNSGGWCRQAQHCPPVCSPMDQAGVAEGQSTKEWDVKLASEPLFALQLPVVD